MRDVSDGTRDYGSLLGGFPPLPSMPNDDNARWMQECHERAATKCRDAAAQSLARWPARRARVYHWLLAQKIIRATAVPELLSAGTVAETRRAMECLRDPAYREALGQNGRRRLERNSPWYMEKEHVRETAMWLVISGRVL